MSIETRIIEIEMSKAYDEGAIPNKVLRLEPRTEFSWRVRVKNRVSTLPRLFAFGAMRAMPMVKGAYPMPPALGLVCSRLPSIAQSVFDQEIVEKSPFWFLNSLEKWMMKVPEVLAWAEMENPIDLETMLYNSARRMKEESERNNLEGRYPVDNKVRLIHFSSLSLAIVMGAMIQAERQGTSWPLPPFISNVVSWLNFNVKKEMKAHFVSKEVLMISVTEIEGKIREWLSHNPYYKIWGRMGKESIKVKPLLSGAINWLNEEVLKQEHKAEFFLQDSF